MWTKLFTKHFEKTIESRDIFLLNKTYNSVKREDALCDVMIIVFPNFFPQTYHHKFKLMLSTTMWKLIHLY